MRTQRVVCCISFFVISVAFVFFGGGLFSPQSARASDLSGGIGLGATRMIYREGDTSATLKVLNTGATTWLTQVRVTDVTGNDSRAFAAFPPLFRLEGGSENSVRVRLTGAPGDYPKQTEGVWYVHVLSIPPGRQPAAAKGGVSVSIENVIKLFWRPDGMPEPGKAVFRDVLFTRAPGGVRACNPGRYYLSFNHLRVDGHSVDLNAAPSMLAPGKCEDYKVKGERVTWSMINDSGGDSGEFSADVSG
ncbi:molecular chaperone [Enterobacter sp. CGMCC 5087]|uniref:fimbrial biogenesis chaperone n=1 Tax=Enterobacter sp. CGMCC 5087 TaxID=2183878 RepID=UPI000D680932|nr:molecular chaperone [Enterobacter sp. CGMCC 5087]PWI77120.1 molecular chaperone [Enterobacter sp. CGMCC 5087]